MRATAILALLVTVIPARPALDGPFPFDTAVSCSTNGWSQSFSIVPLDVRIEYTWTAQTVCPLYRYYEQLAATWSSEGQSGQLSPTPSLAHIVEGASCCGFLLQPADTCDGSYEQYNHRGVTWTATLGSNDSLCMRVDSISPPTEPRRSRSDENLVRTFWLSFDTTLATTSLRASSRPSARAGTAPRQPTLRLTNSGREVTIANTWNLVGKRIRH